MSGSWRLDTPAQTLILSTSDGGLPEVVYWGAPLPPDDEPGAMAAAGRCDITGGMLDAPPPLSICPEAVRGFAGQPGLVLADAQGRPLEPRFRFVRGEEGGAAERRSLMLISSDAELGLVHRAVFTADGRSGLIEARSEIESEQALRLHWLCAPALPASQQAAEMMDFAGRWCGEFQPVRSRWTPGLRLRENRTGRSGHEHFPALLVLGAGAARTTGEVHALHYGWSGGHRMIAEELACGRRQIQFGNTPGAERESAHRFETAPLYLSYSNEGMNGCARAFQDHLRDRLIAFPDRIPKRPVHYNSWEAVYFDHDLDELRQIASRAAELGAERFVLDDGWFARRDDDSRALGDWQVDDRKYPDGLDPLIDHVRGLGMGFGLWLEPEMVNSDSDLYRARPDWVLGRADQPLGRHQMVLDLGRAEVRDHLYGRIAALLSEHEIDYVKWDHNRVLPRVDAAQTRGIYALLDRLRQNFPQVEIESCASGGGRVDFGILARTQRVWLSDSNDALERLRIQHEAALFLPAAATGSHVGPRRCHTSGRMLDMSLRAWTAAQRHMGFEMDPRELTPEEAATLTRVTRWWKVNRDWMLDGYILGLDSADPAVIAELQLARDARRFVVFAAKAAASQQIAPRPLRLTGLEPEARYRVSLANAEDRSALSRGDPALAGGPLDLSGAYLMRQGLNLPWSCPETVWVLEGRRL